MNDKDTRRSLGAADQVEAGGDDVRGLAPTGQVLHERHLVEVEGCIQTVLVHLQLVAQSVDVRFRWRHKTKKHVHIKYTHK